MRVHIEPAKPEIILDIMAFFSSKSVIWETNAIVDRLYILYESEFHKKIYAFSIATFLFGNFSHKKPHSGVNPRVSGHIMCASLRAPPHVSFRLISDTINSTDFVSDTFFRLKRTLHLLNFFTSVTENRLFSSVLFIKKIMKL